MATVTGYTSTGTDAKITASVPNEVLLSSAQALATNSVSMQSITALVRALSANSVVFVDGVIHYDTTTTARLKLGVTLPAGCAVVGRLLGIQTSAATDPAPVRFSPYTTANIAGGLAIGGFGIGTPAAVEIRFKVSVGSTAGNLQVVAAQNVAENTSNPTIYAGSYLTFRTE